MSLAQNLGVAWSFVIFVIATVAVPAAVCNVRGSIFRRLGLAGLVTSAFWIVAVILLGNLHSLNAPILLFMWLGGLIVIRRSLTGASFTSPHSLSRDQLLRTLSRIVRWANDHTSVRDVVAAVKRNRRLAQKAEALGRLRGMSLCTLAAMCLVVSVVVATQFQAVRGSTLSATEGYSDLLRTREMLLNLHILYKPFLVPALTACISLISAVDPLPVLRMIEVVIPLALALATGQLVFILVRSLLAASITIYVAGAVSIGSVLAVVLRASVAEPGTLAAFLAVLPSRSLDFEGCLLVLVLWMTTLLDKANISSSADLIVATLACTVTLSCVDPWLVTLVPILGTVCLGRHRVLMLFLLLSGSSILLLVYRPTTLPRVLNITDFLMIAVAIVLGLLLFWVEYCFVRVAGLWGRAIPALFCLVVAVTWFPPASAAVPSLEYESIAANAGRIAEQFPRQRWIIAAPVEQLAEVYSLGAFEDLASLVEKATSNDLSQALSYGSNYDDLFIFVEKTPFALFSAEPGTVDFDVLTDTTYRNYRSPAGRATLEAKAISLCERYRSKHRNASIFFEDDRILIYRVHLLHTDG